MEKYAVIVTAEGQRCIGEAYDFIRSRSSINAVKWARGLYALIDSLEAFPRRLGVAREQAYFEEELRQCIYKSHRNAFTVDDEQKLVSVVYVRHAKRRPVGEEEREEDRDG